MSVICMYCNLYQLAALRDDVYIELWSTLYYKLPAGLLDPLADNCFPHRKCCRL